MGNQEPVRTHQIELITQRWFVQHTQEGRVEVESRPQLVGWPTKRGLDTASDLIDGCRFVTRSDA
jgi:hypothetical protein